MIPRAVRLLLQTAALCLIGCMATVSRPYIEPPPENFEPTKIDYVDSDAFDALLESALTNQDPLIVVHTGSTQPDWGARLNAWIAAWNMGGKVTASEPKRRVRSQAPFVPQVVVDGDSIREFRLLIDGLMNRVEDVARERSVWWAEERIRTRRVELLKPYNLRFHKDEDEHIQIILFNGRYSGKYKETMASLDVKDCDGSDEWERAFHCSAQKPVRSTE